MRVPIQLCRSVHTRVHRWAHRWTWSDFCSVVKKKNWFVSLRPVHNLEYFIQTVISFCKTTNRIHSVSVCIGLPIELTLWGLLRMTNSDWLPERVSTRIFFVHVNQSIVREFCLFFESSKFSEEKKQRKRKIHFILTILDLCASRNLAKRRSNVCIVQQFCADLILCVYCMFCSVVIADFLRTNSWIVVCVRVYTGNSVQWTHSERDLSVFFHSSCAGPIESRIIAHCTGVAS